MQQPIVKYCPGSLAEGFSAYSPAFLRRMFGGKQVSHILPYNAPYANEADTEKFMENRKRISISGVQEKYSLVLSKNILRLTEPGEQGTYILKPIPRDLKKVNQVPANEHLTMQIAAQVFGINTAENGLIFFKNGSPAYITRRFDINAENTRLGVEDFASLSGRSNETAGPDYKYTYSYEEAAALIRQYVPAWQIEMEKYFVLVLFNYLFLNGDAHLKNFSLLETENGDYFLSPAYDLINTRLHVDDADFALDKGLFADDYASDTCKITFHRGKQDFIEFAKRIGVRENRLEKILAPFLLKQDKVERLVDHSYLDAPNKRGYLMDYGSRRNRLLK